MNPIYNENSSSILRQQPEICPETILSDDTVISNVTHLQSVSKNTATIIHRFNNHSTV